MTQSRPGLVCVFALMCAMGWILPATARAGDLIVRRDTGLSASQRADIRADAGVEHRRMLRLPETELVSVPAAREGEALEALNADPGVLYAEPAVRYQLASDDDFYGSQWALENTGQMIRGEPGTVDADLDVPEAWAVSLGAAQTVAVVDSGIHETHLDLVGNIAPGSRSFLANAPAAGDSIIPGHGTRVAGVLAAMTNNGEGIAGIAPQAKLLSLKAFDGGGSGSSPAVAEALDYAGDLGLRVVNLSFGGPASQAVRDAIAANPETLYVVAAGNGDAGTPDVGDDVDAPAGGDSGPVYPCSYPLPNMICVGATNYKDQVTGWSNYGAQSVDLFAPGESIYTTKPYQPPLPPSLGYVPNARGTSLSVPMVAGEAALVLAMRPNLTVASLRHLLLRAVDPIPSAAGRSVTGGRANAGKLLTTPIADPDGDGVIDELDTCAAVANVDQADADADAAGDVCDPTPRGDDADGDGKPFLDDRCPTVYGTEPDGCPGNVSTPPGPPAPTPTPPPGIADARVLSISVKTTPKRCPRGKTCRKSAKVTVKLTRSAAVSLKVDRRTKRKGRTVWQRITSKSLTATTSSRSLTVKHLARGSYRVTATVAGKSKTYSFRV